MTRWLLPCPLLVLCLAVPATELAGQMPGELTDRTAASRTDRRPAAVAARAVGAGTLRVTFLGTGAPPPSRARMGPSTLVEAGSHKLLFDVGRGASTSIREYGLPLGAVTGVFLTHLHPDHVVGLPDLWLTGHHAQGSFARRPGRLRVWGPVGTERMLSGLEAAYAGVAATWRLDPEVIRFDGREFSGDGVVFEAGDLRVTAFRVPHGGEVTDAYGYRVDFRGRSVVISGDTGYSENLIEHAAGADLLIHEVFHFIGDPGMDPEFAERLKISHTVPETAGRVFTRIAPKLAVAYHLGNPDEQLLELERGVRSAYDGPFLIAEDLMTLEVGDSVTVVRRR